jgi:hypothetical protein
VLVRSHQHQPASVDRDEIRLIEPEHVERNAAPRPRQSLRSEACRRRPT